MVNNYIKINQTNNHLSLQIIEHKNGHDTWRWKSGWQSLTGWSDLNIPAIDS